MFARLLSRFRKPRSPVPALLYGEVMAGARNAALFRDYEIEDSVMGRYDMLALHLFLLTHRLKNEQLAERDNDTESSKLAGPLSQDVFDLFIEDLERAIREIGLGDATVTKRKKRLVHSFYSLVEELDENLRTGNQSAMNSVLKKRYFSQLDDGQSEIAVAKLLEYIVNANEELAGQPFEFLLMGKLTWPDPDKLKSGNYLL